MVQTNSSLSGIQQLSKTEHEFVINAPQEFNEFYYNTEQIITLYLDFLSNPKPGIETFLLFYTQTRNFALLAFLSILRRHDIQTNFNIRLLIEYGSLAAYSIKNGDLGHFESKNKTGMIEMDESTRKKAYKFVHNKYQKTSQILKLGQDYVSKLYCHSNILNVYKNISIAEGSTGLLFFDKRKDFIPRKDLVVLGGVALMFMDIFFDLLTQNNLAVIEKTILLRYLGLHDKNKYLLDSLLSKKAK